MAADTPTATATTRILGLCPKCEDWFNCDTWFDRSQPMPCCARCGLSPATIRYACTDPAPPADARRTTELWLG